MTGPQAAEQGYLIFRLHDSHAFIIRKQSKAAGASVQLCINLWSDTSSQAARRWMVAERVVVDGHWMFKSKFTFDKISPRSHHQSDPIFKLPFHYGRSTNVCNNVPLTSRQCTDRICSRAVASAVILPEPDENSSTTQGGAKKRQSSFSDTRSKRPRLGEQEAHDEQLAAAAEDHSSTRRRSGQMEERKRGQRLFGALLGTLSQSSSSVAQKRRVDIEKKQQAKLKLQAEEYDEKKKQQLEALMIVRRGEQKKYNKQSVRLHISQGKVQPFNFSGRCKSAIPTSWPPHGFFRQRQNPS